MTKCDYCQHVEMCCWRKELKERGCDFFDDGNKWIPVNDRLPGETGTYMTTLDYGKCGIAAGQRYYHGKGLGWEDPCIIAWMPLPEPYKEDKL